MKINKRTIEEIWRRESSSYQSLQSSSRVWLMVIAALITVIILTAVASHTHCHLKPPLKKQKESHLLKLHIALLGKNYWLTALGPTSPSDYRLWNIKRLANYFFLTGKSDQSWPIKYTSQTILLWVYTIHCIHKTPPWSNR